MDNYAANTITRHPICRKITFGRIGRRDGLRHHTSVTWWIYRKLYSWCTYRLIRLFRHVTSSHVESSVMASSLHITKRHVPIQGTRNMFTCIFMTHHNCTTTCTTNWPPPTMDLTRLYQGVAECSKSCRKAKLKRSLQTASNQRIESMSLSRVPHNSVKCNPAKSLPTANKPVASPFASPFASLVQPEHDHLTRSLRSL